MPTKLKIIATIVALFITAFSAVTYYSYWRLQVSEHDRTETQLAPLLQKMRR